MKLFSDQCSQVSLRGGERRDAAGLWCHETGRAGRYDTGIPPLRLLKEGG